MGVSCCTLAAGSSALDIGSVRTFSYLPATRQPDVLPQALAMGWSSDWLYSLLLQRARETFVEARRAASDRSEPAPVVLIATEHATCNHDLAITIGDPVRIWSSADDFASLLEALPDAGNVTRDSHSLFSVPRVSWFIEPGRKHVLVNRWIGPLFGNGEWWRISGQGGSGRLVRSDRRAWVS